MTYEEKYMTFDNPEDLRKEVFKDAAFARFWNPDRLKPIEDAMNKVAKLRNWGLVVNEIED